MGNSWARYKNRKVTGELETGPQSQSRPAGLPAHAQLHTQGASLKNLYEEIALSIINERDTTGADRKSQVDRLSAILKAAQVALSTLKDAPLGIGTGGHRHRWASLFLPCVCCSDIRRGQRPSAGSRTKRKEKGRLMLIALYCRC